MALPNENISMALFCDFENVALGVRDAKYEKFDIKPVLERLLLKGSIVVKKAYCDWERYKGFKAGMHEANFELIEIPHVRQSGKNSADIRLVVDALDLCYTKSHVNTFVIISGDSDFSPLVSKLRENAKQVIGVGVKQSTSDLLMANCDEFIFYDDLVREQQRAAAKRENRGAPASASKRSPEEEKRRKEESDSRKREALDLVEETFEALLAERGENGKIWASVLKDAIKRRKPHFNESFYGFRAFGSLLEEAQAHGLLEFGRDEKSGAYVFRGHGNAAKPDTAHAETTEAQGVQHAHAMTEDTAQPSTPSPKSAPASPKPERNRRTRGRNQRKQDMSADAGNSGNVGESTQAQATAPAAHETPSAPQVHHDADQRPDSRVTRQDSAQFQPAVGGEFEAMPATDTGAAPKKEAGRPRRPARKRATPATDTRPVPGSTSAPVDTGTASESLPHTAVPSSSAASTTPTAPPAKPRRAATARRSPRKPAATHTET